GGRKGGGQDGPGRVLCVRGRPKDDCQHKAGYGWRHHRRRNHRRERAYGRRNRGDRRTTSGDSGCHRNHQECGRGAAKGSLMNIAEIFIRRPVMTTLLSLAIVLFGLMAYRYLPVNDLPNVDFPTIVVNANLPGASPETMASSVATPLEKQFSTISGLSSMTSTNIQGASSIT